MKKLLLSICCFFLFFNMIQARRSAYPENIPWFLQYSYNKYGEKDKILGAQCGQKFDTIFVSREGMKISHEDPWNQGVKKEVTQISFLFDSKEELILKKIEEVEYKGMRFGRAFLISKDDKNYKKLLEKIKKSNYMSICIEDTEGNISRMTEVKNTNSTKILNAFEKSLK